MGEGISLNWRAVLEVEVTDGVHDLGGQSEVMESAFAFLGGDRKAALVPVRMTIYYLGNSCLSGCRMSFFTGTTAPFTVMGGGVFFPGGFWCR